MALIKLQNWIKGTKMPFLKCLQALISGITLISPLCAQAIVTGPNSPEISEVNGQDLVAQWSSAGNAIPISPRHLLTVRHIYPLTAPTNLQWSFLVDGQPTLSSLYIPHPVRDLAVIETEQDMPGYFKISRSPTNIAQQIVIGAHGRRSGGTLSNGAGVWIDQSPSSISATTYAPNTIASSGPGLLSFILGTNTGAGALYDSGGGVFHKVNGEYQLAGLINMVMGWGPFPAECANDSSRCAMFGNHTTFALKLNSLPILHWIKLNAPDAQICVSDFDGNGAKDINDLFAYLNAWFMHDYSAKFHDDFSVISITDLFEYLNEWFAETCQPPA